MTQYANAFLTRHPHLIPVLEYVRDHPGCTTREIRRDVSPDISPYDMRRLHDVGFVRRTDRRGPGSTTRWSA